MTHSLITALSQMAWLAGGIAFGFAAIGLVRHLRAQREAEEWDPY
jgi:hypothetical protein